MNDGRLRLPGVANAHSHAFQRRLRGHVQRRDPAREESFWTWRERMYALAGVMDLQALEDTARLVYVEGLEAGYTAVGEFHYLHHGPGGAAWPGEDLVASSRAHLRAAEQAGVRLTLLWTVYARGGFERALEPGQSRFDAKDLDTVRRALDALGSDSRVDGTRRRLGLAVHSVRAVPPSWLSPLAEEARQRDLVLHVHASEQPAEVDACKAATGRTPIALLDDEGVLGPRATAVHATWLEGDDIARLARSGTTVCVCPTTEGDLGDGVPPTDALYRAGVPLCIGSDSHAVLDPFAELRTLEYQARAATGRRAVLSDASGEVAPVLRRIAHQAGYRSLGLDGEGDCVWLDARARVFEGEADPEPTAWTAGHPGLVVAVDVAGERIVDGGRWSG